MDLPDIEWKGYIESLQQVAKQHTSLYKTRRHNNANKPLIFELDEKPVSWGEGGRGGGGATSLFLTSR